MRRLVRRGAQLANKNERMKTKFKSQFTLKKPKLFNIFSRLFFRTFLSLFFKFLYFGIVCNGELGSGDRGVR